MTVIRPNSISGITSITAQASEINLFRSDGALSGLQLNGVNFNTTAGVSTFATLNATTVSVGGTLTYEDVTNVDSVGVITARDDINIVSDAKKLNIGAGADLQLHHTSGHSYIDDAGSGNLRLRSGTLEITNLASNKTSAVFSSGSGQTLNFNNNTKFVTTNTGVVVTGVCTATSFSGDGSNLTSLPTQVSIANNADNRVITGGSGVNLNGEANLLFDGSKLFLGATSSAAGQLIIKDTTNAGNQLWLVGRSSDNTSSVSFRNNADNAYIARIQCDSNAGMQFEMGGSEKLRIDSSGRLLVGTNSAFTNLGFTSSAGMQVVGAYNVGSIVSVNNENNGNTCAYTSAKIRGTSAVSNGDVVGSHAFDGYDGGTFRTIARIDGVVSSSVSSNSISGDLAFRTRTGSTQSEVMRVTGDGKLTMSSGTVELQSHMVRVGNRTTAQINAGVSTATGSLTLDTTTNQLKVYASAEWKRLRYDFNNGETAANAARSAKELLDNGVTTDGVYFLNMHGAYTQANSKRHYCLMDTSYDGGGWTLLSCHNDGDQFASGTNYHFSLNVGSNPTSVNDFTASNFGYDRRNTFTPASGDQFLVRRTDNNDWRRFVVTTWSPTANSVSNGWETTKRTDGGETQHPYWANGTVYGTGGSAESTSYAWHFNGCALAGNCANGDGGDSASFSDYSQWAWSMNGYKAYGSSHRNQPGASLSWGTSALSEGGSLYIQIFYRKAGTQ